MSGQGDKTCSILVDLSRQVLTVQRQGQPDMSFPVSTASQGAGELADSFKTPRGSHYIRACIGDGMPSGSVFVGRRPTGEIYSDALAAEHPDRDWILTRILWLCGREPGRNRLGRVDSMGRYIYIHGTPDTEPMGVPASHGCLRMRNQDVILLFSMVEPGTPVEISEDG